MPYGPAPRPVEDRFWDHVTPGGPDECWEWEGAHRTSGYGYLTLTRTPRTWVAAHRLAWEMENGPIPEGKHVCHRCDNPPCVNAAHLFVGTAHDNNADRAAKGRGRENRQRGEANTNAKLSEDDVSVLRFLLGLDRWSQREIGEMFGVSQQTVSAIARGVRWDE